MQLSGLLTVKSNECCAPSACIFSRGPEGRDARQSAQYRMHCFPQGSGALAVNDAYLKYPFSPAGGDVFGKQFLHIEGIEGVKVKDTVNGKFYGVSRAIFIVVLFSHSAAAVKDHCLL